MIFVTLGSQKFQFSRLLKAVDKLVKDRIITDEVFAQTGCSDYEPENYKFKQFMDRDEFAAIMEKADIIITHGGTGTIIGAVKKGKKVIAVPRLAKFGEHVDDHQLQLVEHFADMNLICTCYDCDKLGDAIEYARRTTFEKYVSNTAAIIKSIEEFIEEMI